VNTKIGRWANRVLRCGYFGGYFLTTLGLGANVVAAQDRPVAAETLPALSELLSDGEFLLIRAGEFVMGSDTGRAQERPTRRVTLTRDFYLGKYEVKQDLYSAFVEDSGYDAESGGCRIRRERSDNPEAIRGSAGWSLEENANWSNTLFGTNRPLVCVSWNDIEALLDWLNRSDTRWTYRLPTEAEWEYAARSGERTLYSYGDDETELHRYANYADASANLEWADEGHTDGYRYTAPVGTYEANPWGAFDMHGNVIEWVNDWFEREGYSGPMVTTDPQGPETGTRRVVRGGSWYNSWEYHRSANRGSLPVDFRASNIGFRLVREVR
jgi:formylglycine-generating enzyme required for sulfatase activity